MPRRHRPAAALAALAAATVLAGCGPLAEDEAAPPPDDAGIASADADCPGADREPDARGDATFREAVRCLVNAERRARDLRILEPHEALTRAAQRHSDDMARRTYFAHESPDGTSVGDRARDAGYTPRGLGRWQVGENIGWASGGRVTARRLMRGWMESPSHRRNLLTPTHREMGVGVAFGSPGEGRPEGVMATQVFGSR